MPRPVPLDPPEGHPFQQSRHVLHPARKSLQDKAAKAGITVHLGQKHPLGNDHDLRVGRCQRLAGVEFTTKQAQRGLHAGLPWFHGIKQYFATRRTGEMNFDPALQHQDETFCRVAGAKQD